MDPLSRNQICCRIFVAVFFLIAALSPFGISANGAEKVINLNFDGGKPATGKVAGKVDTLGNGPAAPEFPDLPKDNKAAFFKGDGGRIEIADPGPASPFDFGNGDEITIEAWVNASSVGENQNVYIIGKGRTKPLASQHEQQNWALRLRGQGSARISFLFKADGGDFHRWTSNAGLSAGSGWHHVAVSYTFGKPESIRGYIDGVATKGTWDMGGATTKAPTVDDDAVWVASSRGGSPGNSFAGGLDQIIVHRGTVPAEEMAERYRYEAQKLAFPENFDKDRVLVELFEGVGGNGWTSRLGERDDVFQEEAVAMFRVPPKYGEWGVRADRSLPFLLRAYAEVPLPKGEVELLIRGRGGMRLMTDEGKVLATTPHLKKTPGGAHGHVRPYSSDDHRLRPLPLGDREAKVTFNSPGGKVRFILETVVGQQGYRPEVGETLLAYRVSESDNFTVLSPKGDAFELSDDGVADYQISRRRADEKRDQQRRMAASEEHDAQWEKRHREARAYVESLPELEVPDVPDTYPTNGAIDRFIAAKHHSAMLAAAGGAEDEGGSVSFGKEIKPLLEKHCFRCHGEKEKGELRLDSRDAALAGGESGEAALKPGDPAGSFLLELVKDSGDDRMPPKGDALAEGEIALLEKWIKEGAHYTQEKPEPPKFSNLLDDRMFLRRLFLDVVGVIPTPEELGELLADTGEGRRSRWIDHLLEDPRWADAWVPYWQDVLAENPNILKPSLNNSGPFRYWIWEAFYDNRPADQMVAELVNFRGSLTGGGAAGFKMAAENDVPMAAKAHILGTAFLGVEMKCARCHDAPFHASTQEDLFQIAAMLEGKGLKIPKSSSVPTAFLEGRKPRITVTLKPGSTVGPDWPFADSEFGGAGELSGGGGSREELGELITRPENRRFAKVMVNRIWARFIGRGIVESVSDWEGNEPSHPELLDYLAREFVSSGYDIKHVSRLIFNSHVYQRQAMPTRTGTFAREFFSGPERRKLAAEQIVDSLFTAANQRFETEEINFDNEGYHPAKTFLNLGVPERAWEFNSISNERDRPSLALPKAQLFIDMLTAFGWRVSRAEPISVRDENPNVLQPGAIANGALARWVIRMTDGSAFTRDAMGAETPEGFVDAIFLRVLTRPPTEAERARFVALLEEGFAERGNVVAESPGFDETPDGPRVTSEVSWANHLSPEANSIKMELEEKVRKGPVPTRKLNEDWRLRAEDAVWALINSPEMIFVP